MLFKLIAVGLMVLCAIVAFMVQYFVPEIKYKNNEMRRIKIISRVRVGCFLTMLVLLLICIII